MFFDLRAPAGCTGSFHLILLFFNSPFPPFPQCYSLSISLCFFFLSGTCTFALCSFCLSFTPRRSLNFRELLPCRATGSRKSPSDPHPLSRITTTSLLFSFLTVSG